MKKSVIRHCRKAAALFSVAVALVLATATGHAAPAAFSYQGILRDAGGNIPGNKNQTVEFKLYTQAEGGTPVWGRAVSVLLDANGLFNTELSDSAGSAIEGVTGSGLASILASKASSTMYIGIKVVGSSGEIAPRQTILPVPYAMVAADVASASGDLDVAGQISAASVTVALPLKVAKTAVPRKRPILLGVGGYGIDVNNLDAAERFINDLHEHGNEWSTFNVIRLGRVKIKGTDKPLDFKAMKEYASKPDQLPELDFSAFDGWIHANLRRNMTNYRVNLPAAGLNAMFTKAGFPKDKIRASEDWFYRSFSRYLRERGIRMVLTSKGDELHRKELYESWLPWAKRLTAAGFDCTSTFSFGASDFTQLVADLSPYTRLWTLNRQLALVFTDAQRKGTIKLRDDAFIGTYGAGEGRGSEFRKPLTASRFLGWESWRNRISTCSPNPWFKGWIYYCDYGNSGQTGGIGGERWLAYLDFKNQKVPMADCPFWEGIREGMEDGNLAYLLEQRARELNRKDVLTKLNQVLTDTPSAPLRGKVVHRETGRSSFDILVIDADIHGYRKAKSIVLDLLDSLPPQTALYWHRIDLGQAELQGDPAAIGQFRAEVKKRFDGNAAIKPAKNGTIVNFRIAPDMAAAGNYRILEAKKGRTILTVVGGDAAGLKLGVEMFCAYLNQHGKW